MKTKIILFLLLMMSFKSFTQSDYRSGYFVSHKNDTIRGFIGYRGSALNAKSCHYKKNKNTKMVKYSPEDIKMYQFDDGQCYISKKIKVGYEEEYLFLEFLVDGVVNTYYHTDFTHNDYYFIEDQKGVLHELKNSDRTIRKESGVYQVKSNEFRGLLKFLFKDGEKTMNRVDNVFLNKKSLVNISTYYHNEVCVDGSQCIVYERKNKKKEKSFGFLVSANFISVKQTDDTDNNNEFLDGSDFGGTFYPSFGVYYKQSIPNWNEKVFFQANLIYSKYSLSTFNERYEPLISPVKESYNVQIDLSSVELDLLLKYELSRKDFRPNFHLGISGEYYLSNDFDLKYKRFIESSGAVLDEGSTRDNDSFENFNSGLIIGVGLRKILVKNEVSLDLSYKAGFGFNKFFNINNIVVTLGYGFL